MKMSNYKTKFLRFGLSIVLSDENGRDIEARLQIRSRKSLKRLAQETGVLLGSAFTATKLKKLSPV
jgi:hypothetical protein